MVSRDSTAQRAIFRPARFGKGDQRKRYPLPTGSGFFMTDNKSRIVELGIVGARNSGKTTVIEKLIHYLVDKGIRAATIKHTSHVHRFDTPGKDSYRHREAGAGLTIAVSEKELALFAGPEAMGMTQIQRLVNDQVDIWIVEGDRRSERPKVLVTRRLTELRRPYPDNIVATIGPKRIDDIETHFDLNDVAGLGLFVTDTFLGRGQEGQA